MASGELSHVLNQCKLLPIESLGIKIHNFEENAIKNVVRNMTAFLFQPQCLNDGGHGDCQCLVNGNGINPTAAKMKYSRGNYVNTMAVIALIHYVARSSDRYDIGCVRQTGPCLPWGRIWTAGIISLLRKSKFRFMLSLTNSAQQGLIIVIALNNRFYHKKAVVPFNDMDSL